jgi:FlaA1/EpsC-like NDP-sugar epimerase
LSGLEIKDGSHPDGDIEIVCTGLRPGEKLYEELLIGDNVKETSHERIMAADEVMLPMQLLNKLLIDLDKACNEQDAQTIRTLLMAAPTGYVPSSAIVDNFMATSST